MTQSLELHFSKRFHFAGGDLFGDVGAFEMLKGKAHFAIDPIDPANMGVCDLEKAERDSAGRVRFSTDISILKPVDMALGNGRLFFDWGNRGNARCLQFFNDGVASNDPRDRTHAGNGYLMRRGYSVVWCGWQGDLLSGDDRFVMDLPVATEAGKPITGPVRNEYIVTARGTTCMPLSGRASTRSHPTVSRDTSRASLSRRRYPQDPRIPIPADAWSFARVEGGSGLDNQGAEQAIIPSDTHIYLPAGFEPGWIYELVYEGRDPLVLGLGHVAVRDLVSFLKHDQSSANPLAAQGRRIEKAYGWGRSQTGRAIRDFIYRGFNADTSGRKVFDGLLPHVAGAGLMWMNHRFANVVVAAGQQYEDHFNPADRFPFSYASSTDHLTGKTDAILKRPASDPLVLHTQTGTEYWQRRGSLVHTDTEGRDLPQPETVRVYFWSSSQHFADPLLAKPSRGVCQNVLNVVWTSMLFRGALDALDAWVTYGTRPPDSRMPRRADGTLVPYDEWRQQWPAIPGIAVPQGPSDLPLLDFGPEIDKGLLAKEPPTLVPGKSYAILVPQVDSDGNDVAGVRAPMVQAPLATYTGWNLRARGQGHGAMHEFTGSTMPLPNTPEERRATGDPRPSIQERYGAVDGYVAAIEAAARRLVADRLMIEEDVARCVSAAAGWHKPRHDVAF